MPDVTNAKMWRKIHDKLLEASRSSIPGHMASPEMAYRLALNTFANIIETSVMELANEPQKNPFTPTILHTAPKEP